MFRPEEGLPTDVDVVVLGTGLPESILAAACARVGFTVLHLDRNEYYGGPWASFNLDAIIKWTEEQTTTPSLSPAHSQMNPANVHLQEGERLILVDAKLESGTIYSNIEMAWHVKPKIDEETAQVNTLTPDDDLIKPSDSELSTSPKLDDPKKDAQTKEWTYERIMNDWRRFSLDLAPKLLLGRGLMVELLSNSSVGRYAEFRTVNRLLTFYDGSLRMVSCACGIVLKVPCSRSEVFQSTEISMIEKRMLMKFLTFCLNYDTESELQNWKDRAETPFIEFLSSGSFQLTDKLRHYVIHALAMVSPNTKTKEALKSIHEFLMSTGRYGASPFLWTLYGSGELAQCFCRCCAVFGGIYCLRRSPEAWIFDSNGNCTGIVLGDHRITCRKLIADGSCVPSDLIVNQNSTKEIISRAIFITDKPLSKYDKDYVGLLNYFTEDLAEPVKILEGGSNGCVCPPGLYVIHMLTKGNEHTSAKRDLEPVAQKFFEYSSASEERSEKDDRPKILWSLFYNCKSTTIQDEIAPNVCIVPGLNSELTFSGLVPQLKQKFNRLWPDTDFLPPAPNPDEQSADHQDTSQNDPGINGFASDA